MPDPAGASRRPASAASADAIVVGAGLAGLSAARDLRDAGCEVLLLEARDRAGGRAWTRPMAGVGKPIELGGAWINREKHDFATAEMRRYGLELAPEDLVARFRWRFGGRSSNEFPLAGPELYELERGLYRVIEASRRIDPSVPRDRQDLADLDVSVAEFLAADEPSPRTYAFLERFAALSGGAAGEEWSALSALSLVAAFDGSAYAWFAGVGGRIEGGTAALVEALLEDARPRLRLGTEVVAIAQDGESATVTTAAGERIEAGAVILAVPLSIWGAIEFSPALSGGKAEYAAHPHRNRMSKVWFAAEAMPEELAFGPDSPLLFAAPQYEIDGAVIGVGFSAPPRLLDPTDAEAVSAAVAEHFPEARVIAVDGHDWSADPFSRGGWQVHRPGQLSRLHGALQEPEGRVFFAGSDTAVRWIGWFDGALESGARAAAQAARRLDRR
ncbi:MAG: FAD-dependent oxidoreductase [Actinobacteria bacterium]|nr:FAD-dependent oxidoreductase [Actinomycetota bacterium]